MVWVIFALIFIMLAIFVPHLLPKGKTTIKTDKDGQPREEMIEFAFRKHLVIVQGILGVLALFLLFSTSFVIIDAKRIGHLKRIYLGKSMAPGQIIAFKGKRGPRPKFYRPDSIFAPC